MTLHPLQGLQCEHVPRHAHAPPTRPTTGTTRRAVLRRLLRRAWQHDQPPCRSPRRRPAAFASRRWTAPARSPRSAAPSMASPASADLSFQLGQRSRGSTHPTVAPARRGRHSQQDSIQPWPDRRRRPATANTIGDARARRRGRLWTHPPGDRAALATAGRGAVLLRPGHAGGSCRAGRRRCRAIWPGRLRRLQEGPDRAAPRPPEHQCADDRGRHRRLRDRPVARGGDGDGAVRHCRGHRGPRRRPRAQRDQGPAGAGAGRSVGAPGRRHLGRACRWRRWRSAPSCASARRARADGRRASSTAVTSIDQAPVTGESMPVDKAVGDPVFAGTINETGSFEFRVTAPASNSTLARIIHAVEAGAGQRVRRRSASSTASRRSTPRPCSCIALAVALLGPWLLGWTWMQADLQGAGAAGHRLPVRAGDLDAGDHRQRPGGRGAARHPDQGRRPPRRRAQAQGHRARQDRHHHRRQAAGWSTGGARRTAPTPRPREHIAAALAGALRPPGVARHRRRAAARTASRRSDFKALAGRGIEADIDGTTYVLGNHRLIEERGQCSPALEATLRTPRRGGPHGQRAGVRRRRAGAVRRGRHASSHRRARPWRS